MTNPNDYPNDYQVGGDHYRKEYQHWDFACDVKLHYLIACATKYVSRWRSKNGIEDLKKAIHYLEKAASKFIYPESLSVVGVEAKLAQGARKKFWDIFVIQHEHEEDREILHKIREGHMDNYHEAIKLIKIQIEQAEACEPGETYVNPDKYFRG